MIAARLNEMAEGGVTGHLVQVLDPAEETLAYEGRMEFRSPEGSERWVADRVETLRAAYQKKLAAHRASIEEAARRIGWSFLVHHTDRPAAEPLLTLIMRLQGMAGDYRWKPVTQVQTRREARHDARADRLPEPVAARRPAGPAGDLVAAAHHPAAAAAPRVSADPHPGRHREPREDAGADALVAHPDPHGWRPRSSSWRWPSRCSIPTARRRCRAPGRSCWWSTTAGSARRSGARAPS